MNRRLLVHIPTLKYHGGVEKNCMYLAQLLRNMGFQTYFLTETPVDTFQYINELHKNRPELFSIYDVYSIFRLKHLGDRETLTRSAHESKFASFVAVLMLGIRLLLLKIAIHRIKPSFVVIHVTNVYSLILLHFFSDMPIMAWVHTTFDLRRGGLFVILNGLLSRLESTSRNRFIVCANSDIGGYDAKKILPKCQVSVLYPPYDEHFLYPRFDLRKKGQILMVSRIAAHKRIEMALDVSSVLKQRSECDFMLRIVGDIQDPHYFEHLREKIIEHQLQDRVEFVPAPLPSDIRAEYWASNICWNFSEGTYGAVNVEAMACGSPVLATPNMSDVVGPEFTCWDTEEFCRKTIEFIRNPHVSMLAGKKLALVAKGKYSTSAFRESVLGLLPRIFPLKESIYK